MEEKNNRTEVSSPIKDRDKKNPHIGNNLRKLASNLQNDSKKFSDFLGLLGNKQEKWESRYRLLYADKVDESKSSLRIPHGNLKLQAEKDNIITVLYKQTKLNKDCMILKNKSFGLKDLKDAVNSLMVKNEEINKEDFFTLIDKKDELIDGNTPLLPQQEQKSEICDLNIKETINNNKGKIHVSFLDRHFFKTANKAEVKEYLLHRPFFTYWVTFVQIVCFVFAICVYGFAPIGFEETVIEAEVLSTGLFIESVSYREKDNFWIGPRQTDLIHLGAKYSPCMRLDTNVEKAIKYDRLQENETACCIRNDGSGCVQTQRKSCASILSTWEKWNGLKRYSGSVCGQDPHYCKAPASVEPYEWPDSIIEWPICTEQVEAMVGGAPHMTCNLAGRPCCHGIQGECLITTPEHCQFLRGYFHDEATLCSQISCMQQTCGMLPFWDPEKPNQLYRLWTSLFIHAGVLQLLISILFQILIMSDEEKLIGWFRIGTIYIMSGICGSLASAIFIPYNVEAGPSGSQFGVLACILVSRIHFWNDVKLAPKVITALALVLLLLFGLLPMIDNYAHIFGLIIGFMITFSIHPCVWPHKVNKKHYNVIVFWCMFSLFAIFFFLIFFFYVAPIYNCKFCQYFSCIPFTPTFCKSMEISIRREDVL